MCSLDVKAWLGMIFLALVMGLLVFVAAGTVHYWQGWVCLAVFFGMSFVGTLYAMKNDPALLRRRLSGGPTAEKTPTERLIMSLVTIGFVALVVVPASGSPLWLVGGADLGRRSAAIF